MKLQKCSDDVALAAIADEQRMLRVKLLTHHAHGKHLAPLGRVEESVGSGKIAPGSPGRYIQEASGLLQPQAHPYASRWFEVFRRRGHQPKARATPHWSAMDSRRFIDRALGHDPSHSARRHRREPTRAPWPILHLPKIPSPICLASPRLVCTCQALSHPPT